jgi:hypothetical protein
VNGFCSGISRRVHRAWRKPLAKVGAIFRSAPRNKKENIMSRKFAAALVAMALLATPAFAQSSGSNTSTPAAPAAQSKAAPAVVAAPAKSTKTVEAVKHTAKHARKHFAHRKTGAMHQARHAKPAKTHQAGIGKSVKHS